VESTPEIYRNLWVIEGGAKYINSIVGGQNNTDGVRCDILKTASKLCGELITTVDLIEGCIGQVEEIDKQKGV